MNFIEDFDVSNKLIHSYKFHYFVVSNLHAVYLNEKLSPFKNIKKLRY